MSLLSELKKIVIQFSDISVRLTTNRSDYFQYLAMYFRPLIQKGAPSSVDLDIQILWEQEGWKERLTQFKKDACFRRVGDDTLVSENQVVSSKKVLGKTKAIILYEKKGNTESFDLRFQWKKWKDFLRYEILKKRGPFSFFTLTFQTVYYPLFWYLENKRRQHLLHASAIEYQGKGIVFCGMEGIGKTTLATSLLGNKDSHFLSDNLIIYDEKNIYPCYELIRICLGDDLSRIESHFTRVDKFSRYKDYYACKDNILCKGTAPSLFLFPVFSKEFFVSELAPEIALQQALISSYLPSELSQYLEYRFLYNLIDTSFSPEMSERNTLRKLLQSSRSYMIGMPKADGIEKNLERVKQFLAENLQYADRF